MSRVRFFVVRLTHQSERRASRLARDTRRRQCASQASVADATSSSVSPPAVHLIPWPPVAPLAPMDGNKDESERCIQIAERKIKAGDYEAAIKFLRKADKLYPSQAAQGKPSASLPPATHLSPADLIREIEAALGSGQESRTTAEEPQGHANGSAAGAEEDSSSVHRRRSSAGRQSAPNGKSRTTSPAPEFSAEQVEAVRRIKKCKDYYEILGIEKQAAEVDIKKAYKKLALQFHPDKNSAPGADEAFKMIGNAFAILSDPQKRKQYDTYGSEDPSRSNVRSYERGFYRTSDYTRGFEAEISPEDLFNMFFGSGNLYAETPFRRQRHQRQGGHQTHTTHEAGGYGVVLQMMPVIILISLSLMSSLFVSEPAFSLIRTK